MNDLLAGIAALCALGCLYAGYANILRVPIHPAPFSPAERATVRWAWAYILLGFVFVGVSVYNLVRAVAGGA